MTAEFEPFPKIPRLFRECQITEKIDGTNAGIRFEEADTEQGWTITCQSRKRIITPSDDNAGFARWAFGWAAELWSVLGPGLHFGEWWGQGIQRGYDGHGKTFSLFNAHRWLPTADQVRAVPGLDIVPLLYQGTFTTDRVRSALIYLEINGSEAAPGYARPEGVIVWHSAARQMFKALIESDDQPKGTAR